MRTNALYYGDNIDILREYIDSESVDLIYLDPPFNSNRDYNVIFRDESGKYGDAQIGAFEDTWHWGRSAETAYVFLTNTAMHGGSVPDAVSKLVAALREAIGTNQMLAYLVEMAIRLVELHRVLTPTGSLYLHCDSTASHYLKALLDAIFGPRQFRNEIVWKRTSAHSDAKQGGNRLGRVHDIILFYAKGPGNTWNPQHQPYTEKHVGSKYNQVEVGTGRRYTTSDLTANKPGGDTEYDWHGVLPPAGRYWAYSKANMERFEAEGRLVYTRNKFLRYKRYLDEMAGVPLQDLWTDIAPINSMANERLGWNTQKPLALLERIIALSSDEGDVLLDPFCGCGTAVVAAQKLGRRWIGIDITYLAIGVMESRLRTTFDLDDVTVVRKPTEVEGARQLAKADDGRYEFQWWALSLIDARPFGGKKKGADRGIDGVITFTGKHGKLETVIVSVKSGVVNRGMVGELRGTVEREKAAMGIFITLEEPSPQMRLEADAAGFYRSDIWNRDYPKLQILTIRDLLERGRRPDIPPFALPAHRPASRIAVAVGVEQHTFLDDHGQPIMRRSEDSVPVKRDPGTTSRRTGAPRNRTATV